MDIERKKGTNTVFILVAVVRASLILKYIAKHFQSVFDHFVGLALEALKLVSAIFYQIFIFNQMIALQKLWKMFFISSKKLYSF